MLDNNDDDDVLTPRRLVATIPSTDESLKQRIELLEKEVKLLTKTMESLLITFVSMEESYKYLVTIQNAMRKVIAGTQSKMNVDLPPIKWGSGSDGAN